ncbi:MAG: 4-hydroxy-tetrahydrodipicolinate reductase [Nitrospiria bacterium]
MTKGAPTKILVKGAGGRMGSKIVSLALKDKKFQLAWAVELDGHPFSGKDSGEALGLEKSGIKVSGSLPSRVESHTVCIDFTVPESTVADLSWAEQNKTPLVVGTTGLSKEQVKRLTLASEKIPVVYSPNMSIGVNMMFKVLRDVALKLGREYDMEIVEMHHSLKKDAPSGTAIRMAQILSGAIDEKLEDIAVYHRQGMIGERKKKEIGIQSVRAGDIVGEHTVYFAGMGERLEITHKATSRDNFAKGALMAAAWVAERDPGLYDMQAVLGL